MSRQRMIAWLGVFGSVGLAVLGFLVFVIGLVLEFLNTPPDPMNTPLSPTIQVALAGLCLSGLMVMFGFGLIMVLLARQTRRQAPGYGDAYRFMQTMQFSRAIPVLERAIEAGRETSEVLAMLTSAYAHEGQLARAQATADRAVRLFPSDPGAYVTLANGYRLQASYDEAARALQTALDLSGGDAVIRAELGFVQQQAGNIDAAFTAFEQAAAEPLPPMYGVRVYYHLMNACHQRNQPQKAQIAREKMHAAASGLDAWKPLQQSMAGTAYGQHLRYEIASIEAALQQSRGGLQAASTGERASDTDA
jgi:tetratricopeptide (TPR) repeat protein